MNVFKAFLRALRDERVRSRRRWLEKDRVVRQTPKYDPRSSIEMHKRITGDVGTPAILRRQAF